MERLSTPVQQPPHRFVGGGQLLRGPCRPEPMRIVNVDDAAGVASWCCSAACRTMSPHAAHGTARGDPFASNRRPGVSPDDAPHLFYRAAAARSLPGSGLGPAIAHDVAELHVRHPYAGDRPGGGAVIGFTLGTTAQQTE